MKNKLVAVHLRIFSLGTLSHTRGKLLLKIPYVFPWKIPNHKKKSIKIQICFLKITEKIPYSIHPWKSTPGSHIVEEIFQDLLPEPAHWWNQPTATHWVLCRDNTSPWDRKLPLAGRTGGGRQNDGRWWVLSTACGWERRRSTWIHRLKRCGGWNQNRCWDWKCL